MMMRLISTFFVGIIGFTVIFHSQDLSAIILQTNGQPTMGHSKAPVHIVVFEEPKCSECKRFTNTIFPRLKKEFIETNQALFTIIPVSFLPNSMPAAIAWMCVFHQEQPSSQYNLFFKFVDYMYMHQPSESKDWVTTANLLKFAKETSSAIKLDVLKGCLDREAYRNQIEKNTEYGMQLMNEDFGTPSLYINGEEVKEINYKTLTQMINDALRQKESKS